MKIKFTDWYLKKPLFFVRVFCAFLRHFRVFFDVFWHFSRFFVFLLFSRPDPGYFPLVAGAAGGAIGGSGLA